MRDRAWLRSFLRLDARARDAVPLREIDRQEDTVLRALHLLDAQPGVVLADEVGMGKTYEALGVVAARQHDDPSRRTLILTPGPNLNEKWRKEVEAFCEPAHAAFRGFEGRLETADSLGKLLEVCRRATITVAPVNIFAGSRSVAEQAYLLALWARYEGLKGNQISALLRRYNEHCCSPDVERERFLGVVEWPHIADLAPRILEAHKECNTNLHRLWQESGYDAFEHKSSVDRALAELRFRLLGALLPDFDLLIVDEAHKLKNENSVRATGVRTVFSGRFDKALFLTATPFQLTVEELRQVFALFQLAKSAPATLMDEADQLLDSIREYQGAYDAFESAWAALDGADAAEVARIIDAHPDCEVHHEDPNLRAVTERANRLLQLKRERVEPALRKWMIRSLREDKRVYRKSEVTRLRTSSGGGLPFLLYERLIAELFRVKSPTHKAAVQINMVSSYGAAREGALLTEPRSDGGGDVEAYRTLMKQMLDIASASRRDHPKLSHVASDAVSAALQGEKTLVFCARVESLRELKRDIEARWEEILIGRWREVFPDAQPNDVFEHEEDGKRVRGYHATLRDRFNSARDALSVALRERYVETLLQGQVFARENLAAVVARANEILSKQRLAPSHAKERDWGVLKRCVEQATAILMKAAGEISKDAESAAQRMTTPEFVVLGYDLTEDDAESSVATGRAEPSWTIDEASAALVLRGPHLWSYVKGELFEIPPELRTRTVERLASYLVKKHVAFLPDLLAFAKERGVDVERVEAATLLPVVDQFWTSSRGRPWTDRIRAFLRYAAHLPSGQRREVLDDLGNAGHFVRHTIEGESRERLREAFNTPLYPMILIANEVMQEGLDLHHHCRRVVHHDLAWNPAQLEQRVGRVDRLGSLVQRMRAKDQRATLDVGLPVIAHTIDERLERTVRMRERWLEFLLGAPPKIEEYGLADEPIAPLPVTLAAALRVDLGPVVHERARGSTADVRE